MYEVVSIISGAGAAIWSKINFGPTGHHHPRGSRLLRICTVPSVSATFKCILEVVIYEGVQFCLSHFNCVKMAIFQLEREKNRRGPS
jgi:hypothetical protein